MGDVTIPFDEGAALYPGDEIRQLCALKDREAIAVNLMRHGGLNKHHARRVADVLLDADGVASGSPAQSKGGNDA